MTNKGSAYGLGNQTVLCFLLYVSYCPIVWTIIRFFFFCKIKGCLYVHQLAHKWNIVRLVIVTCKRFVHGLFDNLIIALFALNLYAMCSNFTSPLIKLSDIGCPVSLGNSDIYKVDISCWHLSSMFKNTQPSNFQCNYGTSILNNLKTHLI